MRIDDTRPIWIQLADSFRGRITDGTWKPGEKIPSVRDLAIEAGTNPNTVQRALSALDEEGLTVPKRTAGRFVATDEQSPRTRTIERTIHYRSNTGISDLLNLGVTDASSPVDNVRGNILRKSDGKTDMIRMNAMYLVSD